MGNGEDKKPETSLADLLLSNQRSSAKRSKPPSRAEQGTKTTPVSGNQLDLLFSAPETPPQLPPQPAPAKPMTAGREQVTRPAPPAAVAPPPVRAERQIWTVLDLVTRVRQQLEREYEDIWVEGEISNCRPASSGHVYFTIRDGDAQLPVVLFRRQAMLLKFRPQDGLAVLVRGRVSVYESRGQLQMIAETMEPRGAGALQIAFEQLKARLMAEGLFDSARKRLLPPFPRCVGVVTSTGGAVLHDIIKVIRRRHACLNLLVYPAVVQGPGCPPSVVRGIRWFNANPEKVDLIVIARGGGSLEDLAGFNDEALARAIAASELPVVSAIGHETDFTIADFVADLRAPTPSAAAELITAAQHRIEERVQDLDLRLRRAVRYHITLARQRFAELSVPQVLARARDLINRRGQRIDDLTRRLELATTRQLQVRTSRVAGLSARVERQHPGARLASAFARLDRAQLALHRLSSITLAARRKRLDEATVRLQALSPLAVLQRGYALVYNQQGTLVRDATAISAGETVRARLAKGTLEAEVRSTQPE